MNLERGFRRLVLTISLAAASAGLLVTGYDSYKTVRYVSATNEVVECWEKTRSWIPTMEDLKMLPDEARPRATVDEKMDDVQRSKWIEAARNYRHLGCGNIRMDLPAHLGWALELWMSTDWLPLWVRSMTNQSYTLALFPAIWGILVTTALGVIPWGMFYLVRWIVQGFKG